MTEPSWHFKEKRPSDIARDPISSEFFADESVEDAARSIIREAVQNSLDARDKTSRAPVEIRIHLGVGADAVPPEQAAVFFDKTWEHLGAERSGLRDAPLVKEKCEFLTVEDFGTAGLEGDTLEWAPKQDAMNAFYAFFRAEAYSEKSGDDRGRWGVGKLVFPRSSRGSAFFGYTVQRSTETAFLMGRMILRHHKVNGVEYVPDAFFGIRQKVDGDPDFVAPVTEDAYTDRFRKRFHVTRVGEPGLSVVVPWLDLGEEDEFTVDNIARAVVTEYILPILRGELVATIKSCGRTVRLDKQAVLRKDHDWVDESLSVLLELAQFAATLDEGELAWLKSPEQTGAPKWPDQAIAPELARKLREALESGSAVAVNVPIAVYKRGKVPKPSSLRVHLLSAGSAANTPPVFVREGITITNVRGRHLPGYASLVTIDDGPLATLLGDSENPAHTEWRQNTRGFKDKYLYGKAFLEFVRLVPINIFKALFEGDQEDDVFALGSFFPDLSDETDRPGGGARRPDAKKNPPENPSPQPPPAKPRRYSLTRIDGGFEVKRGDSAASRPKRLRIRAAYDVRRGNPLKHWVEYDFEFGRRDLSVDVTGATIAHQADNELVLEITDDEFQARVSGFDVNRDLFVRVIAEDADGDQTL